MATYYLTQPELLSLFHEAGESDESLRILGLSWADRASPESLPDVMAAARTAQSPKGFFMPPAESVGRYGAQAVATAVETVPATLVGARACELRAQAYLDQVLQEGAFPDPRYAGRRENTTIISCDCVDCADSCFCTLVGGNPYPTSGYDVNLSPVDDGYVADVATDRGQQWLDGLATGPAPAATPDQLASRDRARSEMADRLVRQNEQFSAAASDEKQPSLPDEGKPSWQQFAADCVECGACTNICPTCHCFYLYDQALGEGDFERLRNWDSCLLGTYHRMAGGNRMKLTPRPVLSSRLANRILHKFDYSPQQYDLLGCVGCGRCIDACLGAIDIREVLQELSE